MIEDMSPKKKREGGRGGRRGRKKKQDGSTSHCLNKLRGGT
jgi:hypothetical protein